MSKRQFQAVALRWRARLVPDALLLGWTPFYWLGYLGFLFIPPLFGWIDLRAVVISVATIPPFLWLYFRMYRSIGSGSSMVLPILGTAALAYALLPFNMFANTYMIFVASAAAFLGRLPVALATFGVLLAIFTLETWWLEQQLFGAVIAALVGTAVCAGNYQWLQKHRKDAELRLSHEEIRRLAQVAERERIGRDLHDLLGHTLSLIALKSELASKLMERDPVAARVEIAEVERVAREALAQVRRAVTGIRAAAIRPELASARMLLDGAGVDFQYSVADIELTSSQETCLALVLREAVTNIHRHAHAHRVEASLRRERDTAVLTVIDDGRGGSIEPGNGLRGMDERLRALGGELRVVSSAGEGTRVVASIPVAPAVPDDAGKVTPLHRSAA
jgi:two-component system sensor histidine kinase DesK